MTVMTVNDLGKSFAAGSGAGVWSRIDRAMLATDRNVRLASPGSIAQPSGAIERRQDDAMVPVGETGKGRCAPRLLAAIHTALRLKAADRPQSIAAWRRALSGATPSMLAEAVAATRRISPTDQPARGRPCRRCPLRLAAAVLVLCLGGGRYVWAQPPQARDCAQCPDMVRIPAGSFAMGAAPGEHAREYIADWGKRELPQHKVTIGYTFSLGKYEVTRGEFEAFVRATGRQTGNSCTTIGPNGRTTSGKGWRDPGFTQTDRDPVVCVGWEDAKAYVAWLSQVTGKKYGLPTEAEWEYAARAGTTSARYWGDDSEDACRYANIHDESHGCNDGQARTAPVGRFEPNRLGLYDMVGNAWEWTEDCWNSSYKGAPADGSSWQRRGCSDRVVRGGSWLSPPDTARAAGRSWDSPQGPERRPRVSGRPNRLAPVSSLRYLWDSAAGQSPSARWNLDG